MDKEFVNTGMKELETAQVLSKILDQQATSVADLYQRGYDIAERRTPKSMTPTELSDACIAYGHYDATRAAFKQRVRALAEDPGQYDAVRALAARDEERCSLSSFLYDILKTAERARLKSIAPEIQFDLTA